MNEVMRGATWRITTNRLAGPLPDAMAYPEELIIAAKHVEQATAERAFVDAHGTRWRV